MNEGLPRFSPRGYPSPSSRSSADTTLVPIPVAIVPPPCARPAPALRATIPRAYDGVLPMKAIARCVLLFAALSAVASAQNSSPVVTVARWPQDRLAAISLTFDDGINTHLDFVAPILKKHHLNATFFVATAMGPWEKRKPEWKQLALDGNELANHTVHHPCLLEQIIPHSQDYTPAMFEAEIRDAALDLAKTLNSSRGLTFAYPCGNMSFGKPQDEVANAALYLRYVSEHAFAARAVSGGPVNADDLNVLAVADLGPTAGKGFPALLAQAEPAFASHNWGVFCFHGVGGDWLAITPEALDELAAYLEGHPEIWTASFGDVPLHPGTQIAVDSNHRQ